MSWWGGIVTESHVAAYSASAERRHLVRERCLVVVVVAEKAAVAARDTYNTHSHTLSLLSLENAQRARVEEAVACTGVAQREARSRERFNLVHELLTTSYNLLNST